MFMLFKVVNKVLRLLSCLCDVYVHVPVNHICPYNVGLGAVVYCTEYPVHFNHLGLGNAPHCQVCVCVVPVMQLNVIFCVL